MPDAIEQEPRQSPLELEFYLGLTRSEAATILQAIERRKPMAIERCCVCDGETGRAGQADDSIFLDLPDGEILGPLCVSCCQNVEQGEKSDVLPPPT